MFKIGELAKASGIDPHTLRYYEKIGLIPKPERKQNNYRQYGDADLERLEFIKRAKALGLSLNEIAHILDLREKREPLCRQVRKILEGKLRKLENQIDLMIAFRQELQSPAKDFPEEGTDAEICGCIETHKKVSPS